MTTSLPTFTCPHCGKQHPLGTLFCPETNLSISEQPKSKSAVPPLLPVTLPPVKQRAKPSAGLITGTVIAGVVVLSVILLLIFGRKLFTPLINGNSVPIQQVTPTSRPSFSFSTATSNAPTKVPEPASGDPRVLSKSEFQSAMDEGMDTLEFLAVETYDNPAFAGNTYTYTVNIPADEPILWTWGWCAIDRATLDQNFSRVRLTFTLNGKTLSASQQDEYTFDLDDQSCRHVGYLLDNWPEGLHDLMLEVTYLSDINDGWYDYEAGTFAHLLWVNAQ